MRMVSCAFEIQDGVDDVLERLGPGQTTVLGDVTDKERRHVPALRRKEQLRGGLSNLTDASGRGLKLQRKDRLHGIDDDENGLDARDLIEHALEARLGQQIQRGIADGEPLAARLDLVLGFLAGTVEHRTDRARHVRGRLEQQRRLSYARLPAEQHQRTRHHAAAEHAIEFSDARRKALVVLGLDVRVQARARRQRCARVPVNRGLAA